MIEEKFKEIVNNEEIKQSIEDISKIDNSVVKNEVENMVEETKVTEVPVVVATPVAPVVAPVMQVPETVAVAVEGLSKESKTDNAEQLSADVLREQLSVVKKTREELAKVYSDIERMNKESLELKTKSMEMENSNKTLSLEKESLSNKLKVAEEKLTKIEEEKHLIRLEKLSNDFKLLGKEKSVEQLKSLPHAVISEFEDIVVASLKNKKMSEQLEMPKTMPSEALSENKRPVEKLEKSKDWKKQICEALSAEQGKEGTFNNRTVKAY